jgi:hypothetical protein
MRAVTVHRVALYERYIYVDIYEGLQRYRGNRDQKESTKTSSFKL